MPLKLVLSEMTKDLDPEPLVQGEATNAQSRTSCKFKIRAIFKQLSKQNDVLLNNNTDNYTIITISNNDPDLPPTSGNTIYLALLELLTSLEEDAIRLQTGEKKPDLIRTYKATAKEFKTTLKALATDLGI